ncbi:MAG TPA: serine dehydratase subunit alpha family protein [Firmicutes bacterium]|jgi:L-cysteine desulfidase|nr:serine dehydratase subunit alpha family protein [Bacillota bacterium]
MALTLKQFLASEVRPAFGCTEPGAVALAAARAREELGSLEPSNVTVEVSDSIYKNGMNVGVPGADGMKGNAIAAALGVLCGRSELGLEALSAVSLHHAATARAWVQQGRVRVARNSQELGVYIRAAVHSSEHEAACVIRKLHSHIAQVTLDGRTTYEAESPGATSDDPSVGQSVCDIVAQMSLPDVIALADSMDADDASYLLHGAAICRAIAEYSLERPSRVGLGMGRGVKEMMADGTLEQDLGYLIRQYACAAADARMAGVPLPVMSSAGSGNHGITAILPVAILGEVSGRSEQEIAYALAVSHLATSYVKSRLGRLTSICGCAVAAGSGAAAGMVTLLGGSVDECTVAMQTVLASTVGMICDGAKDTCSLRVGVGATESYFAALLAMRGQGVTEAGGVVGSDLAQTVNNIGIVNAIGMKDVDSVTIGILEAREGQGSGACRV